MALGVLVIAGVLLRLLFMLAYRPALLGYPDTGVYITGARGPLFWDPLRAVGYAFFLRAIHGLSTDLSFTIVVQHALGVATALLLFSVVRRVGGPPWLGLVPAAVVLLGGDQLFFEHAVLSESLYTFLTAAGLYAAVHCIGRGSIAWPLLAGVLMGLTATVRVAGVALLPVLAVWLALSGHRQLRRRLAAAAVATLACGAVVFGYLVAAHDQTGAWSLARHGAYHFYGRVAPFAECSQFKPPAGTGLLCERTPPSKRPGPLFYIFEGGSPAVRYFGEPQVGTPTPSNVRRVRDFAETAALNQPLDYLQAVGKDLFRYIWPSAFRPSYASPGPADYQHVLIDPIWIARVMPNLSTYYTTNGLLVHKGLFDALGDWESVTRIEGPVMVLLLVLMLAGPFVCRRRERAGAALLAATTLALMIVPVAAIDYDGRFAVPAYGPLSAAAALGGSGLVRVLRNRRAGVR